MLGLLIASMLAAGGAHRPAHRNLALGETYVCHFPKHGLVIIDTRDQHSSITVHGKKYPARGGSYFFVNDDNPDIEVMFGPNMKWWEYGEDGERATSCSHRRNLR
ncbi:MAG TPA: hypothetical protein VGF77_10515 [Allosphingosinicella sp.]|jgi:hypothetical protein